MKKRITIDPDLWEAAKQYANTQLDTMAKFGSKPELTVEQFDKLVYDSALYPQQLRNFDIKLREKGITCLTPSETE